MGPLARLWVKGAVLLTMSQFDVENDAAHSEGDEMGPIFLREASTSDGDGRPRTADPEEGEQRRTRACSSRL